MTPAPNAPPPAIEDILCMRGLIGFDPVPLDRGSASPPHPVHSHSPSALPPCSLKSLCMGVLHILCWPPVAERLEHKLK